MVLYFYNNLHKSEKCVNYDCICKSKKQNTSNSNIE